MGMGRAFLVQKDKNMVIQGDNLEVMNCLLDDGNHGKESIDLMLWDPPYNTGNRQFMYKDSMGSDSWLSFMRDRLLIAKDLLKKTGTIAIHISYHELFRLGMLLDDVFGESNRLGIINWECSYAAKNDSNGIPSTTDYVLVYAKEKKKFRRGIVPRTEKMNAAYSNPDNDKSDWISDIICLNKGYKRNEWRPSHIGGSWTSSDPSVKDNSHIGSSYKYGIQNPFTGKIYYAPSGRAYRINRDRMRILLCDWNIEYVVNDQGHLVVKEGQSLDKAREIQKNGPWPKIYFGKSGTSSPVAKRYFNELKNEGRVLGTYWDTEELGCVSLPYTVSGHNGEAKKLIKNIMGGNIVFDTPKPLRLTELLVQYLCPRDGIVLDAFAGSGTTAHAVLSLNAKDPQCDIKFILIELNEYAKSITCERIQRVIDGSWAIETKDTVPLEGSFEFLQYKGVV
jgi:adenine-specific DNA-methyltransferase